MGDWPAELSSASSLTWIWTCPVDILTTLSFKHETPPSAFQKVGRFRPYDGGVCYVLLLTRHRRCVLVQRQAVLWYGMAPFLCLFSSTLLQLMPGPLPSGHTCPLLLHPSVRPYLLHPSPVTTPHVCIHLPPPPPTHTHTLRRCQNELLRLHELVVMDAVTRELVVAAHLDDAALGHDDDLVRALHKGGRRIAGSNSPLPGGPWHQPPPLPHLLHQLPPSPRLTCTVLSLCAMTITVRPCTKPPPHPAAPVPPLSSSHLHGAQPVRNDNDGAPLHQPPYSLLHQLLADSVEGARRLV